MSGPFGSSQWMYASGGFYDFPITNSLRFNDGDSAYLGFTPSSAGNRRTWTWSSWVKLSNLGTAKTLFGSGTASSNDNTLDHTDGSIFYFYDRVAAKLFLTDAVYRDPSAWYNVVFVADTTNSTAGDRLRLFVNGVRQDGASGSNYPDQNTDLGINNNVTHFIGARKRTNIENFYDGYLAETCFIDGTALAPSSFGETKNDIWIPKDTSGLTFGDQGWRLQYKQTGTGTAGTSTIGADTSGEGNHWTSTNLVASDVTIDSPTNNFATFNSILPYTGISAFEEGNTTVTFTGGGNGSAVATIGLVAGKWYWETKIITTGNGVAVGIVGENVAINAWGAIVDGVVYVSGALTNIDGTEASFGATFTDNDIIGCQLDLDSGTSTIEFFKNGASQGSKNLTSGKMYFPSFSDGSGATSGKGQINTGNPAFSISSGNADGNGFGNFEYAPASGFLAICTANLPDPVETIDPAQGGSPQDYFNTVLYTGTGSALDVNTVGFQPDWVWLKQRNAVDNHVLFDSVRGAATELYSNLTNAESGSTGSLTAFDSAGFNLGNSGDLGRYNESSSTYVAWNWKAGTAFSNDASATSVGSIDSAGSVNSDLGFSIINFTGTGSALTVAHGLSQAPELIIEKSRDKDDYWLVYVAYLGNTKGLILGNTNSVYTSTSFWNDTSPTSSVWTMGDQNAVNNSGEETIAYCFHSVENYSKIGSYTGNGNADGPFVYTGFRPAWVMHKRTDGTGQWAILDNTRSPFNVANKHLYADGSNAEVTNTSFNLDYLSNGFKVRSTNTYTNASGGTYIYMAFAEQPTKYANGR